MHLLLLGPLELWANGQAAPLGGSRQRALLALLALRAGEVVPRDRIIEALWGEAPPEGAAHRLDVQVSRLRASMRKAGADPALLETAGGGYRLRLNEWALDVHEAERLVEQGRRALAEGLVQEAAETLRAALDLWRGPMLLDLANDPASQTDARRLEELRVSALEDRIEAELALGRHLDLVPELHQLVAEHPLRERLRAQLMSATPAAIAESAARMGGRHSACECAALVGRAASVVPRLLLPQPHGIEGFRVVVEVLRGEDPALAHRPDAR
jgi:DNA-binding SARP family transcriptional activator